MTFSQLHTRTFYTYFFIFAATLLLSFCASSQKTSLPQPDPGSKGVETVKNSNKNYPPDSSDSTYVEEYTYPKIKGGLQALQRVVKYPREAARKKIQGNVVAKVYLDKKGIVQHIDILQSPNDLLSKATKNAINRSKFEPAKKNGKPVKSSMSFPVLFRLH